MRRALILLLAILVVTACAGRDQAVSEDAEALEEDASGATGGAETPGVGEGDDARIVLETQNGRQVIRTASMQLHAGETRAAFEEIVALVESKGGFVASANVYPTNGEDDQPDVEMTLRVPAESLRETMDAIGDLVDKVVAESQTADDVTEQFVDLEARLTNLEALETELRALLTEVRMQDNADPEKIITVFNELSSVRGQIEQIQGQLEYLENATTLATLDIHLTQTPSAVPIVEEPWEPAEVAREAVRDLVAGLQGAADWAISFALYALPMLLITIGPLLVIGVLVYRKWFRRTPTAPAQTG
jgi:hypothetical protein